MSTGTEDGVQTRQRFVLLFEQALAHDDATGNTELLFDPPRECSSSARPGQPAAPHRASRLVP